MPNPTPATTPAAAIHPTVGLAAGFEVPTTNVPPVVVAVPNTPQLAL